MGRDAFRALLLSSADFDAFLEPIQDTRYSTRARDAAPVPAAAAQRRALRERIAAWAHRVAPRLSELGVAIEVVVPDEVEQHLSSRSPRAIAQRVLLIRDAYARGFVPRAPAEVDPLRAHAYLALTIDSVHVEVSLEICPEADADVRNLRTRISDPTLLLELMSLFQSMPEEFAIGVIGVPSFPRVKNATADEIRALLDDSQRSRRPFWIGWSIAREVALAHVHDIDEQLADAIVVLGQAYKLVAWGPDNDLIAASRRGAWRAGRRTEERERTRDDRRKRRKGVRKGPVRVEGSRREREAARSGVSLAEREAPISRRAEADDARDDTKHDAGMPRLLPRRPILPTSLRARGAPAAVTDIDPNTPIERGTRVRVLAGPFSNKIGVVEELDAKGRARVRLGLLAATLDLKDIVASADGSRPRLASSHRRPRNARSR